MSLPTKPREQTRHALRHLGFFPHHTGYRILIFAIDLYSQNGQQSITKELYPTIAREFGYIKISGVEHSIRYAITEAWAHGDSDAWKQYFPSCTKAPTNLAFIATLAEYA